MENDSTHNQLHDEPQEEGRSASPAETVNPLDLVTTSDYPGDRLELLGNPGFAPQMLDDRRDIRVDLYQDSEETDDHPSQ